MIGIKLHSGQFKVATDPHRFRVLNAGRRFGKSVLARQIMLQWACKYVGNYWLVSPAYRQGKMNHWDELKKEIPKGWILKKNEVELSVWLKNGSVISLKGAESPDSLRGQKLRGLVVDECASIREWEWLWAEVLRPTLTDYTAPAFFISTPNGFNHWWKLFNRGQGDDPDYKSFHFTSYDNPFMPKEEIDKARSELSEDQFSQEYMADFRTTTGLAHKFFKTDLHVIEPFDFSELSDEQKENATYMRGWDFGAVNPTTSVRAYITSGGDFFIDSCYSDSNQVAYDHAHAIKSMDYGLGIVPSYGDPSNPQFINELTKCGIHIKSANRKVGQGHRGFQEYAVHKINALLERHVGYNLTLPTHRIMNSPKLFIFRNESTEGLIKQIQTISWRATSTGEKVPVLDESGDTSAPNGHYDLVAALRYLIVSYTPPTPIVQPDFAQWRIG